MRWISLILWSDQWASFCTYIWLNGLSWLGCGIWIVELHYQISIIPVMMIKCATLMILALLVVLQVLPNPSLIKRYNMLHSTVMLIISLSNIVSTSAVLIISTLLHLHLGKPNWIYGLSHHTPYTTAGAVARRPRRTDAEHLRRPLATQTLAGMQCYP